jgi:hypothetical protein
MLIKTAKSINFRLSNFFIQVLVTFYGYSQTERGSSSKTTYEETQPRSYVETVRGYKKFHKEDYKDTPLPRRFRF